LFLDQMSMILNDNFGTKILKNKEIIKRSTRQKNDGKPKKWVIRDETVVRPETREKKQNMSLIRDETVVGPEMREKQNMSTNLTVILHNNR